MIKSIKMCNVPDVYYIFHQEYKIEKKKKNVILKDGNEFNEKTFALKIFQ